MTNPVREYWAMKDAQRAHQAAAATPPPANHPAAVGIQIRLAQDMKRLHSIQSIQRKIEVKREILPEYAGWVNGALLADSGLPDEVLMTVMVWRIDVGDIEGALNIARHALKHDLSLPARYQRTLPCLVAEEVAETAFLAKAEDLPRLAEVLVQTDALTHSCDMPDEVRAKLKKAIGLALVASDPAQSLTYFEAALALFSGIGVKKEIERVKRALKQPTEAPEQNQQETTEAAPTAAGDA